MSRTLLIVDPDQSSRRSLELLLQELGVMTVGVSGALDALSVLQKRSDIALLLTEECLHGPSGSALLQAVRFLWPNTIRVLLGENLRPDVLVRAVNCGKVHRILSRDMHPVTLRDEVQAALDEPSLARDALHFPGAFARPHPTSGASQAASLQIQRRRASGT